jgi:Flp pilus assembly protein TadD
MPDTQVLLARARRSGRRGERRRELVSLREAALLAVQDPKLWALYGGALVRAGRHDDARYAFGQALYFRERARDTARAHVLRAIIERLELGRAA